jgi:hypothetical protein
VGFVLDGKFEETVASMDIQLVADVHSMILNSFRADE